MERSFAAIRIKIDEQSIEEVSTNSVEDLTPVNWQAHKKDVFKHRD